MIEIRVPRDNANDDMVMITGVKVNIGHFVKEGDGLFSFETSKATVEIEAPTSGYVTNLNVIHGQLIKVDSIACVLSDSLKSPDSSAITDLTVTAESPDYSQSHISDAARRLIQDGNKFSQNLKWISSGTFSRTQGFDNKSPLKNIPDIENIILNGHILKSSFHPIDRRKKLEIDALTSNSSYINSTLGIDIETGTRRHPSAMFDNSILDIVLYETFNLLKSQYSDLNRYYFDANRLGVFEEVIPGYALDNGNNLTVLNVGDFSNLKELENNLIAQITRYESNKLLGSDLTPTTFTVTDLSSTKIDFMLPLINGLQGFILGIIKINSGFRVFGTFDHRVTDGRRFAGFLGELSRRVRLYFNYHVKSSFFCHFCEKSLADEKALFNRGFIKIEDGSGEKLICRSCFDGW